MKPRDYQEDLIAGILAEWRSGKRRTAGVMATGGGKTIVFSHIGRMALEAGAPTLVIAHRKELLDQAIGKLRDVNPDARVGLFQGTTKQYMADFVVAGVLTAVQPAALNLLRARKWGLIIVDETHHVAAASYQTVLRELRAFEPDGPLVLGVTATLARGDRLALGDTFESVAEPRIGLIDLIRKGWLVRPRGIRVRIADLDLNKVSKLGRDFNQGRLGAAMSAAMAPKKLLEAWLEHAPGRPTMAFLPTVAVSIEVAETFRAAGVTAVHLDAKTPDDERATALDEFRAGRITMICNNGLFTEGTDLPTIGCVIPKMTMSETLYQQMIGRGLRPSPGKADCVILDPSGVTSRHKLAILASLDGAAAAEDTPDDLLMYEPDAEAPLDQPLDPGDTEPAPPPDYADGDLAHEMIDLFGESHSAWLRTTGGTWFLSTPAGFVYLASIAHGRYDLCWAALASRRTGTIQADMEIGYAMAAGDEYVAAVPQWQTERSAAWRSMKTRGGGITKGDLHDRQAVNRASHVLDRKA